MDANLLSAYGAAVGCKYNGTGEAIRRAGREVYPALVYFTIIDGSAAQGATFTVELSRLSFPALTQKKNEVAATF